MNNLTDEDEPNQQPVPSTLPELYHPSEHLLSLTPVKEKKKKETSRGREKKKASKKVVFVEKNNPQENKLSKPILHTTNLLKKDLERCRDDEFTMDRALKEIQLSDSFNTAVNEQLTCFLNYKLDEKKYSNLVPIHSENENEDDKKKPVALLRKVQHVPRANKKKDGYKPDPFEFWTDKEFITEKPCVDFSDLVSEITCNGTVEDNTNCKESGDELNYLFYAYRKNLPMDGS